MAVKLELIDELRKRANVSYEDAKDALEKCNGDIVEALIYLEKQNKTKTEDNCGTCTGKSFFDKIKKLIKKGNNTKFILRKGENIVLSLPVTVVVIFAIIPPHITIWALIIALITGHRIKFQGKNGEDMAINKKFEKVSDVVDNAKKKIVED